jgi:hypothetical protein
VARVADHRNGFAGRHLLRTLFGIMRYWVGNVDEQFRKAALDYHRFPSPGKIAVLPIKDMTTQRDLAPAYSPGVAAATLATVGTIPVAAMALILGIDRFMSEARALTNLIGNSVATIAVAKWEGVLDEKRLHRRLNQETDEEADEPEAVKVEDDVVEAGNPRPLQA